MPKRKLKGLPKADVEAIFGAFAAVEPEPKGELEYVNSFTLLVAVVLSAQATDAGVNKATRALFKLADTPEKMVALGVEPTIEEMVKTIGLFRTKAKNVFALSQALVERFSSEVPQDREALESLPGVGPEDRQCGAQHRLRPADHRGRYAPLPRRQPHRPCPGRNSAGGRAGSAQGHPRALSAPRPSLADPPRPLCLQGAEARVLALRHPRLVPVRAQDTAAEEGDATAIDASISRPPGAAFSPWERAARTR